jgi:hypothetical protein
MVGGAVGTTDFFYIFGLLKFDSKPDNTCICSGFKHHPSNPVILPAVVSSDIGDSHGLILKLETSLLVHPLKPVQSYTQHTSGAG